MPLTVIKKGKKHRIIEANTKRIAKNDAGTALDGGGHKSKDAALKQIQAINISKHR